MVKNNIHLFQIHFMKTYSLEEVAQSKRVTRQAVAYQVAWRKIGTRERGKIMLTEDEVAQLSFRQPNRKRKSKKLKKVKA